MKAFMSIGNVSIRWVLMLIFVFITALVIGLYNTHAAGLYETPVSADPLQNPIPTITNISPESRHTGDTGFTLTVTGTDFIDGSLIKWDLTALSTQYITTTQLTAEVPASYLETPGQVSITVENPLPGGGVSNVVTFTILMRANIYFPISIRSWPPQAHTPVLAAIDNADQNTTYTVNWSNPSSGATYILEEAWNADFTNAGVVYQGPGLSWTAPTTGKLPGKYYYRVKAKNAYNESEWSNITSIRIYPLFVGLKARWDGKGFIRTDDYYDTGTHQENQCDQLSDPDTIRCSSNFWYDPNPKGWDSVNWNAYYSVTTGVWKGDDHIGDPSWKWGHSWKLAYDIYFTNGSTVKIDNQEFTVTGPHWGYTTYGQAIQYWEFVNQKKFLYWDSGGDWTQYVHPGDVILRYDAGSSGLIIYDSVLRRAYYQGELSPYTVQYIDHLTSTTSLPGSPPVPMSSVGNSIVDQPALLDSISLEDGYKSVLRRGR